MYDILKLTIMSGNLKLSEIQQRIKRLYATGDINETQFEELFGLLAEKVNPELERPETLILIQTLFGKLESLIAQVKDLTGRVKALEGGDNAGGSDEGDTTEYPAWTPWDGLSNDYHHGAIVSHNDQLWQSVYSGQNVWEPGTVDDRFWAKYTEGGAE